MNSKKRDVLTSSSKPILMSSRTLKRNKAVNSVSYSFDGSYIAIGGKDMQVAVYDTLRSNLVHTIACDNNVLSVCFSKVANEELLAFGGSDNKATIYLVNDWTKKQTILCEKAIKNVSFSYDAVMLAIGGYDRIVTIYDVAKWQKLSQYHIAGDVFTLSFAPNGLNLAVGTHNPTKEVRVYDLLSNDREIIHKGRYGIAVSSVCYSSDGSKLAVAGGNKLKILNSSSFNIVHDVEWELIITCTSWSPVEKTLLAIGDKGKNVKILDVVKGGIIQTFERQGIIRDLSFHPSGKSLAIGGFDSKVVLVSVSTAATTLHGNVDTTPSNKTKNGLNTTKDLVRRRRTDSKKGIATLNNGLDTVKGNADSVKVDLTAINNVLATVKNDIAFVKDDVAISKTAITMVKDDATTMKDDVASLKEEIASMKESIKEIISLLKKEA